MVIVVAPFREVVRKLQARCVGVGVLEINHDQLSMFICRVKQWRFPRWLESHKIAILGLKERKYRSQEATSNGLTSLCAKTSCCLTPDLPPWVFSICFRYFSTARLNTGHSTPQTKPRCIQRLVVFG